MTLEEFNRHGERHAYTDHEVDAWQTKMGKKLKTAVFEGRTGFHFIPHSVKVFFDVDLAIAARRIMNDTAAHRRFEADFKNLSSVERALKKRIASDSKRYQKYYHLDIFDRHHYDLVIDTTKQRPVDTLNDILSYLAKPVGGKTVHGAKPPKEFFSEQEKVLLGATKASSGAKIKQKKPLVDSKGTAGRAIHRKATRKKVSRKRHNMANISQR